MNRACAFALVFASALVAPIVHAQSTTATTQSGPIMVEIRASVPPPQATVYAAAPAPVAPPACPAGSECHIGPDGQMHVYQRVTTHRMTRGLVLSGALLLGIPWLVNVGGSALGTLLLPSANQQDFFGWGVVPLVGPLVQMTYTAGADWMIGILAVIEACEVAGLIMAIIGTVGEEAEEEQMISHLHVVPWASPTSGGLSVGARF